MRALVTGGTGFLGRHLVRELVQQGWEVTCIVRKPLSPTSERITCVQGDLRNSESLLQSNLAPCDVLFHFGAQLPSPDVSATEYFQTNSVATSALLEVASALRIEAFVYASSLPVVGRPRILPIREDQIAEPNTPYHLSKLFGEMACDMARRVSGRRISCLRITSPYGPGMPQRGVLATFAHKALRSEPIQWLGSGTRAQNFVHVSDVVQAALKAAQTDSPGIYNVGGSETTSMKELAQFAILSCPESESVIGASSKDDPEEGIRWEVDLSKAASGLGYTPQVPIEQGLSEYVAWLRSGADPLHWWKE